MALYMTCGLGQTHTGLAVTHGGSLAKTQSRSG